MNQSNTMKNRSKIFLLAALLIFSTVKLFATDRDSLLNHIGQTITRKITERRKENEERIRLGLKPDYVVYVGQKDLEDKSAPDSVAARKDFPPGVISLTQKNTLQSDAEKIWDFNGNPTLQSVSQQLQTWSANNKFDYYIVVCAIYNYFQLNEETKFNNITWDNVGTLVSKSGSATTTPPANATNTTTAKETAARGNYHLLFNYLINKFKSSTDLSQATRPFLYHFVITTFVPSENSTDNHLVGRLHHFQGVYWHSPNGDTLYDNVLTKYIATKQSELAGRSSSTGAPASKEDWLSTFTGNNQTMIAGILSINEADLMAITDASIMASKLENVPVQVLGGFSQELRIHVLRVLSGVLIPGDAQSLVVNLISQAPASQADGVIKALRDANPYIPATLTYYTRASISTTQPNPKSGFCLLQCLTEQENDKFLGIWGDNNYHDLVVALTKLAYQSTDFHTAAQQLNDSYNNADADNIPDRYILYTYNSMWSKVANTFLAAANANTPVIDWNTSYLAGCQLSIQHEVFFCYLYPKEPQGNMTLDPFAPIIFENNSDLGLLSDISGTSATDRIVPALVMKYADAKGTSQTVSDVTMAAIDVASLATGLGELNAGITGIRKAWVLFDMFNSGINLSLNVIGYKSQKVQDALAIYNLITGAISAPRTVGDIYKGIKSVSGVLKADNIKNLLKSIKNAGSDMSTLTAEDEAAVEMLLTRIKAESDARIAAGAASQDLNDISQSAAEDLALVRGVEFQWVDNLKGWDDAAKAAIKEEMNANAPLKNLFENAADDATRTKFASTWKNFYGTPLSVNPDYVEYFSSVPAAWTFTKVDQTIEVANSNGKIAVLSADGITASGRTASGETGNLLLNRAPAVKNTTYNVDGYVFHTDGLGRVSSAEGDLLDIVRVRLKSQQIRAVDVKDGIQGTDQGGHIFAARFFGPGEQINYFPMAASLNLSEWKAMENEWAESLVNGFPVEVKVKAIYGGSTARPDEFEVTYTINGESKVLNFDNE
jgi:hypothetical protein